MSAKFIVNNKRYVEAYDSTDDMNKPYIITKKAIRNHSIINKNYYTKLSKVDNDGDHTNNAKIHSRKRNIKYFIVTNIIPKKDFIYTGTALIDSEDGNVFSGLYKYVKRNLTSYGNSSNNYQWIKESELLQKNIDELTNIKPIGSAKWAFAYAHNMTSINGVESTWDTSEITDMSYMFLYFGQNAVEGQKLTLDMSNWDFSNVTSLASMFDGCMGGKGELELLLPPEGIVAPKLTNISHMFNNASSLRVIPMITTKNITNLDFAFDANRNIEYLPLWDTSNVTSMNRMFQGAGNNNVTPKKGLRKIAQIKTSKVKDFTGMFSQCYNLQEVPELDTSNAECMAWMFISCTSLPAEFPWVVDCSSITQISNPYVGEMSPKGNYGMFSGSSVKKVKLVNLKESLKKSLNLGSGVQAIYVDPTYHEITQSKYKIKDILPEKYNTMILFNIDTFDRNLTNIEDISEMFKDCVNLYKIPVLDTSTVTNLTSVFENCKRLDDIFPWTINISSITDVENLKNMFKNTPVIGVKFRCPNQKIKEKITSQLLRGDNKNMDINYTSAKLIKSTNSSETMKDIYPNIYTTMDYVPDDIYVENISNTNSLFKDCSRLICIPWLNTNGITSSTEMFYNCNMIDSLPSYDTSEVVNASYMFYGCNRLTNIPISDFSKLNNANYIFGECGTIKTIDLDNFNLNNLKNVKGMFYGCINLEEISGTLNINNVTDTSALFSQCYKLNNIPELDTSKVTSMSNMFNYCRSITTIPEIDTSKTTDINCMFSNCTLLRSIPQLNTSNVTDMSSMFYDCNALTTVPEMDTSKVTNFTNMFSGCTSLPYIFAWEIDISSVTDINNLKNIFAGSSVTRIVLKNPNDLLNLSKIDASLIFNSTNKEVIIKGFEYSYPVTDSRHKMSDLFSNYQTMTSLPKPLTNTSTLTDANNMFYGCKSLTTITTSETYNFDNVKDASHMFDGCSAITKIPKLKIDMVEDTSYMFISCSRLTTLDLSNIDFSNIKNTHRMFYWCENLSSLTMPDINSPYLTDTSEMFQYCKLLKIENIPYIDTSKVTSMHRMFSNCTGLTGEFPYALDCSSIKYKRDLEYTFGFNSLTKVKLKNVPSNLKSSITKELLFGRANSSCVIEFID